MNKKLKVVGIDLGTTNSCVAVIENGEYVILPNAEDGLITPSYVAFNLDKKSGELLSYIGEAAQRQAYANTKNTVYVFKRLMGKKFSEIGDIAKNVGYNIEADSSGNAVVNIYGQQKKPIFISGIFLKTLIQQIKERAGCEINEVVITVPANFNDAQRLATKEAGKIAGLKVLRIISEPTAAAMAYGMANKSLSGNVLVYDLGGGTFDVTLVEINDGFFNVLGTGGDMNLGGEDFDQMIYEWILAEFKNTEGIDLTDNVTLHRIKSEAKKSKELLSSSTAVNINIPYVAPGPKHVNVTLTRSWFEDKIRKHLDKTINIAKDVLKKAEVKTSDVTRGILVGGSTRISFIKSELSKALGIEFYSDVSPDVAVAVGAAYQASVLSGETQGLVLMDVTPLNIGIETVGGVMTSIIEANSKIPSESVKVFTTAQDNQTEVDIKIYQGNRPMVEHNKLLDTMKLSGIKAAPRGAAKINVKLAIDANGILTVSANEETSNLSKDLRVTLSDSISSEEIKKMQQEAESQKERDEEALKKVSSTNECEQLVYEIGKNIAKVENAEKKAEFDNKLNPLKEKISTDATAAATDLRNLLTDISNYNAEQSKMKEGKDGADASNKSDDPNTSTDNDEPDPSNK